MSELEVSTVKDEKWLGIKNGDLIKPMLNAGFDIFITNDQSLGFQQQLVQYKIIFINHCCPGKILLFGLKPTAVLSFSNPSLKAGVIRTKPLTVGL
ncbi:MAG: hypothetical protein LH478_11695 [Chitinophagaceae bacterium]|nr:hypothetical protein [Chitinophagaceae bacterium]